MTVKLEIDQLDKQIISALLKNAREPYSEMAQKFKVSTGTIHVRIEKLKQMEILDGSKIKINYENFGYGVCCFIGINLKSASDCQSVLKILLDFSEVIEGYTTTGKYSLFIKVITKDIAELNQFLIHKIQAIHRIQSTETIICLSNPIQRDIVPD